MSLIYNGNTSATIDSGGIYVIDRDLTPGLNQNAITIAPGADYVTLLLRSRIEGQGGAATTANGITATSNPALTIVFEGGSLRGFYVGVSLTDCYLARVIAPFIRNGYAQGVAATGNDIMVRDGDIRNIGGTTAQNPSRNFGIEINGYRPRLLNNHVENVTATEEALGLAIEDGGLQGIIKGNVCKCDAIAAPLPPNGNPGSYGVWVGGNSDVDLSDNLLDGWGNGIGFSSVPSGFISRTNRFRNCTANITGADPAKVIIET